ncbi:pyruvoyl-dependent arginine decarboxylase [Desulfofundulus thermosubterraneus]|uniref:Pyruvoyl-dependent arginine decarboxylase AaxB n=1 Tax=Desulfofundulus thermosubterraneus DSM 16057 TaxID=1121432 RepID=A0A1M6A6R4_9FIRM|nr:arginine decarboxylase, pyruvoyl-dependent [Desulfofundulus thermosubterraneus]SHI32107.1 arginine decarboxylase [Desulfofundulus thermosubterraneus DSM 16057]
MLPTPTKFTLVAGAGEGQTPLNAFDRALLEARAGNVNLIRVSSILPPGAEYVEELTLPPGALVPVAYGATTSTTPGDRIAAAVAVGIPEEGFGVIMEYSGHTSRQEAERIIRQMVEEAFATRRLELKKYMVRAVEHQVVRTGAVFAGILLWY